MDRETRIAPASGAEPPDAGKTAAEPRPPDPPGLGAIRRFFRQPWIQGIWAWLCLIGRGIRAGWKWLDKNADPIARGIEKAGNTAARVSRGAVKAGHAAGRDRWQARRMGQGSP